MSNPILPPAPGQSQQASEYDDFITKLAKYHEERGTTFEAQPRVGPKPVNLLQLYKAVIARGGYDKVSDEKLAWRKLTNDLGYGGNNLPASAFQLKSVYYKFLAAYEIKTEHGKEPPPKEILEDLTAKGGQLLTRTLENFRPSSRRETSQLGMDGSGASEDDGTPARDMNGMDDIHGSGGGRSTRGLRQAPPQRVLFQPDTTPARQSRQANMMPTSAPQGLRGGTMYNNGNYHMPGQQDNDSVSRYEPRSQVMLTMRPVYTPSNNPKQFEKPLPQKPKILLPGTCFDGPNIYVRCLLALKSGIPDEQHYALHHLVKISMERGDKYRFESFAGLAEALIDKVLEITGLITDSSWEIAYPEDGRPRTQMTLDGLDGTPDILERLEKLTIEPLDDNIQPEDFRSKHLLIVQASLALRNMVMLPDNAHYVSEMKPLRDMLSIVLNLPNMETFVELKHNALDIAEQLTKYLHFEANDPLYMSLLKQLESSDRGAILTALGAISRISMLKEETNRLPGVPTSTLELLSSWLLLQDEELVNSVLDFFYQYTAVPSNLDYMISQDLNLSSLINQVSHLLTHNATQVYREYVTKPAVRHPAPADIPAAPADLMAQLLPLPEPERSSKWLRCIFEEDKDEAITQIALWQAYQARFDQSRFGPDNEKLTPKYPILLAASEFIKNVSTTFAEKAAAQVQGGPVQKFIIKGIRIREAPVDLTGKPYSRCKWVSDMDTPTGRAMLQCNGFYINAESMYNHILSDHVGVPKREDGKFKSEKKEYQCLWKGCRKYLSPHEMSTATFASHISIHLPRHNTPEELRAQKEKRGNLSTWIEKQETRRVMYLQGQVDEHGDAAGISLTAVLVLRNLARNLIKTEAEVVALKQGDLSLVTKYFKPIEPRLFYLLAHSKTMVSSPIFDRNMRTVANLKTDYLPHRFAHGCYGGEHKLKSVSPS